MSTQPQPQPPTIRQAGKAAKAALKAAARWLLGLSQSAGSLKGYLNLAELLKVLAAFAATGGSVWTLLAAIGAHAPEIFGGPYAPVLAAFLAAFVQLGNVLRHGEPAAPPTSPTPPR